MTFEQNSKKSVAIIDFANSARANRICDLFREMRVTATRLKYDHNSKTLVPGGEGNCNLQQTLLVLFHAGDAEEYRKNLKVAENCTVIFYGGFGENDHRIASDDQRINYVLESERDVNNNFLKNDRNQLLEFAYCEGSKPNCILPSFKSVTTALTHLCEGYLAVWAQEQMPPDTQCQALERMGWHRLPESVSGKLSLAGRFNIEGEGVKNAKWWTTVFMDCKTSINKSIKAEIGDATIEKSKWVTLLLSQIEKNQIKPNVVAKAYLELKAALT